jgi:hypothetical protein
MLGKHLRFLKPEESKLTQHYDAIQFFEGKQEKKKELRASAFPTCPLIWLDNLLFPQKDLQKNFSGKEFFHFQASIGGDGL